ncbi:hypothetical protein C8J56DRAFT_1048238 [Mycena floridula]|nr:hypothetical protein C8J56DRAFT_1048238 [Mycena floridula]
MTALDNTLGPLLLGAFVASIFAGFTQDKLLLRTFVYGVWYDASLTFGHRFFTAQVRACKPNAKE